MSEESPPTGSAHRLLKIVGVVVAVLALVFIRVAPSKWREIAMLSFGAFSLVLGIVFLIWARRKFGSMRVALSHKWTQDELGQFKAYLGDSLRSLAGLSRDK